MVTEMTGTLYSAIKGHEDQFEKAVFCAFEKALNDLGADIYKLDWACSAARVKSADCKAA
jgi:hypothetical protein